METRYTLRIGGFDVEPSLNRLSNGEEMLTVEPRVMDLLMLLAESPGQVFGRDEILQRVWPETTVQDDALRRVVTLLRRVLEDDPKEPRYIETITRRGYRLVAPVSHPEAPPPDSEPRPAPKRPESVATTSPRRWVWLMAGALLLVVLSVATVRTIERADPATPVRAETQLDLRPLTSLPGHESSPVFSPDGSRVAFIHAAFLDADRRESALMVKGIRDGEARQILVRPWLTAPAWSPDGNRVLVGTRGADCEILSAEVEDPSMVQSLYTCSEGERLDTVLQPDDETLIFSRRPARFGSAWRTHRYDLVTRESTQLTLPAEPGYGDLFLALSADRQKIAVIRHSIGDRSKLLILDWATGAHEVVDHFPDTIWHLSWSPDGKSFVFADGASLYRLGLEGGSPQRLISSPRDLNQPSVSPVGDRLAVVDQRMFADIVRQPNPLVGPAVDSEVVASSTRMERMPRFGPNGERLAFLSGRSGRSEIWVSRTDGELDLLFGLDQPNHIHAFLWSPEGDKIAVSDHHSRLLIVDVATGDFEVVPGSSSSVGLLDWSADGSSIYRLEVTDGSPEVWQVGLDDGNRRQITRCGVKAAQEAPDGRSLYVMRQHTPGLWRVELEGDGQPTKILDDVAWFAWKSSDRGIYSFESNLAQTGIYFRESATGETAVGEPAAGEPVVGEPVLVLPLPALKLDFSVSTDHRWLAYAQATLPEGDLVLIEERSR